MTPDEVLELADTVRDAAYEPGNHALSAQGSQALRELVDRLLALEQAHAGYTEPPSIPNLYWCEIPDGDPGVYRWSGTHWMNRRTNIVARWWPLPGQNHGLREATP